ncbi:hypothetical protein LWI28_024255 [Acer negundo]|uniref:RNase H type-1 domain-containing protein n=1 Tax=Acer negundo TaxID=4023 RepID=A0AAD5I811_ACENE|nr:hypothetical protein LWI28_024255 [Acer negundo]
MQKEATSLCSSNSLMYGWEIVFVSDSKVAISWINDVGFGNLKFVDMVYDIQNCLEFLDGLVFSFSPRSTNSYADNLAKRVSSMGGDFIN